MKSKCPHNYYESEAAVYTEGLCPICLQAENERLRAALQEIADMRYDNTSAASIARRALEGKC